MTADQAGYAVLSVKRQVRGNWTDAYFADGISDNVVRFDLYTRRGSEYADPLSKLRYVRVCYEAAPTSQAALYDITEADCEALTP